jgi:DNA end-binding protein Ku
VHFNQFQKGTNDRIRYKRVNERTGQEVNYGDIVKGREVDEDTYVLLTDEDLEAVEPGRSRTIDITDFVDLSEVDPIYFQRTYYLAPRGDGAERSYALLHQALAATNRVGIATLVMRSKEYLVAIRPQEDILTLETMYFADEIRDPADATGYEPSGQQAKPRELDIAQQLIESMTTDWDPENYHDTYRQRVEDLIESKRKGEEITAEAPAPRPSKVVDLTETLRRSVEEARGRRGGSRSASADGGGEAERAAGGRGRARTRAARTDEGPSEEDLSGMTKSQLAALAAELGISGRSRMSRDELENAIREARHPRPKAVS